MKCKDCNYKDTSVIADPFMIKCKLTGELYDDSDDCHCDFTRTRRDKEARLLREKADASEAIEALKHQVTKPRVDPQHVINILTDTTKDTSVKITEAIEYLEDFV